MVITQKDENMKYDVLALGSPLLDIIVQVSDEMLVDLNLKKGGMHLISLQESKKFLDCLSKKGKECLLIPGGSAANTLSGLSALGNKVAFLGLIGDDEHGDLYEEKTQDDGVKTSFSRHEEHVTGHAITFITPDQERTFATHLGAAAQFSKEHVPAEEIRKSKVLHIEAYQLEDEKTREAVLHAMDIAKKNNIAITIDLSDVGLIERNLEVFKEVVKKYVNVVFVNEDEAHAYTGKKEKDALEEIAKTCDTVIVKLGEKGSLIQSGSEIYRITPHEIEVINTNGAGDMYAAGILHGMIHELPLDESGRIASHIAALAVASQGARLDEKHLKSLKDIRQ